MLHTKDKRLRLTASALLILTIAVTVSTTEMFAAAQTSQITTGVVTWLHTYGTEVRDEQNRPVRLVGPNFSGGDCRGLGLTDLQKIKAMGFNTIRIMMPWARLQPYGEGLNGIDERYFAGIYDFPLWHGLDEVVNWTISENMYLMLTLWWGESEPPPTWAFPGITDNRQRNTALILGESSSKERTGIANTWKFIANRYKNVPNIIFEIFNELFVLSTAPNYPQVGSAYKTFNENIISSIESVETKSHLKVVELLMKGESWEEIVSGGNDVVSGAMDVNKTNVAWAFHYYAPMTGWNPNGNYWHESFTWRGTFYPQGWGNGTIYVTWRIQRVCDNIRTWKKPLMVTEFAKETTETQWEKWYQVVLSTISGYAPSGWIMHEYASNPQFGSASNLGNPTYQQAVLPIVMQYFKQLYVKRRA